MSKQLDIHGMGVLIRVGGNVIVKKHPIVDGYVILSQAIDNDTKYIMINSNEINDLIDVLKDVNEFIHLEKD